MVIDNIEVPNTDASAEYGHVGSPPAPRHGRRVPLGAPFVASIANGPHSREVFRQWVATCRPTPQGEGLRLVESSRLIAVATMNGLSYEQRRP
jgi:hypothetical protein